jgi:hypothetical protein
MLCDSLTLFIGILAIHNGYDCIYFKLAKDNELCATRDPYSGAGLGLYKCNGTDGRQQFYTTGNMTAWKDKYYYGLL